MTAPTLAELDAQRELIAQEIAKAYSTIESLAIVDKALAAQRMPLLAQAAAQLPRFSPVTTTDRTPTTAIPALASRS